MTREMAHLKSFEKALHAIEPNFPPGKLPGMPEFQEMYVNASQGEGDLRGPWNSDDNFDYADDPARFTAVDGGDGGASVMLSPAEERLVVAMAERTMSDPASNPVTGLELGKSPDTMAKTPKVTLSADDVRDEPAA